MTIRTSGSLPYSRSTIVWLSDPAPVRQLPRLYRLFARYCATKWCRPVCAEILLGGIIALERRKSSQDGILPL